MTPWESSRPRHTNAPRSQPTRGLVNCLCNQKEHHVIHRLSSNIIRPHGRGFDGVGVGLGWLAGTLPRRQVDYPARQKHQDLSDHEGKRRFNATKRSPVVPSSSKCLNQPPCQRNCPAAAPRPPPPRPRVLGHHDDIA